ncbi:MAG: acetolactate synthase small subunit [bacterium]|jgi:acetolactate synthase-1/3 small subunit
MQHTLSVLVLNNPGVMNRISGLFSRRGYNIESIAVGITENPSFSRMTIVVEGDDQIIEQVAKQLHKLLEVVKVNDVTEEETVDRELALIKVQADAAERGEIMQLTDIFRAKIVDVAAKSLIIEVTGDNGKVDAIIQSLRKYGIREIVRTGKISIQRGNKADKIKEAE